VVDVALGFAPPTGTVSAAAAAFDVDADDDVAAPAPKAASATATPGGAAASIRTFGKATYAPALVPKATPAAPAAARPYPGASSGITPGVSQVRPSPSIQMRLLYVRHLTPR